MKIFELGDTRWLILIFVNFVLGLIPVIKTIRILKHAIIHDWFDFEGIEIAEVLLVKQKLYFAVSLFTIVVLILLYFFGVPFNNFQWLFFGAISLYLGYQFIKIGNIVYLLRKQQKPHS